MSATETTAATLYDYHSARPIRPATPAELAASIEAERHNSAGVIDVDGRRCYVI